MSSIEDKFDRNGKEDDPDFCVSDESEVDDSDLKSESDVQGYSCERWKIFHHNKWGRAKQEGERNVSKQNNPAKKNVLQRWYEGLVVQI